MTKAAAYLRLSREDGDKTESDSIANQRSLIRDYVGNMPDTVLIDEFADDGFSGTGFDRPAFLRLLEAAKAKRIDCIIVKDLSRLGRNYIEAGRYIERIFPMLGVRFISVLDNYDSASDDGSGQMLISFKNIINDAYCRDISAKIRSSLDTKRKNGEFIGSFAAYGYKKDVSDHNRLVIDEYAADIVRQIFMMKLAGYNAGRIAKRLSERDVPTPAMYIRMCGDSFNGGSHGKNRPKWNVTTVTRILKNEVYTGTMVQNKMRKINYKLRECRPVDPSEWIRVEGTHEAIIPLPVFNAVQHLLTLDTRTSPKEEMLYPFSGIMKCGDCGENMIRRNSYRDKYGNMMYCYVCSGHAHNGSCSSHNILEKRILPAVLAAIRKQCDILNEAEHLLNDSGHEQGKRIGVKLYESQIAASEAEERKYLDLKIRLYGDMRDGIISREEYADMSASFTEKAEAAGKRRAKLEKAMAAVLSDENGISDWLNDLKAARELEVLDRNTVVTLIEKIVIHGKDSVEVIFRHGDEMAEYIALAQGCRMEAAG